MERGREEDRKAGTAAVKSARFRRGPSVEVALCLLWRIPKPQYMPAVQSRGAASRQYRVASGGDITRTARWPRCSGKPQVRCLIGVGKRTQSGTCLWTGLWFTTQPPRLTGRPRSWCGSPPSAMALRRPVSGRSAARR
ncbi:hypothetical protein FQN60_003504, partial [Etheostoma spectabile]